MKRPGLIAVMILTPGWASALWIYPAGEDLMRWLGSRWRGRRLALTVARATVLVAGAFWLLADPQPGHGGAGSARDGR